MSKRPVLHQRRYRSQRGTGRALSSAGARAMVFLGTDDHCERDAYAARIGTGPAFVNDA